MGISREGLEQVEPEEKKEAEPASRKKPVQTLPPEFRKSLKVSDNQDKKPAEPRKRDAQIVARLGDPAPVVQALVREQGRPIDDRGASARSREDRRDQKRFPQHRRMPDPSEAEAAIVHFRLIAEVWPRWGRASGPPPNPVRRNRMTADLRTENADELPESDETC